VKADGVLTYATCSIFARENRQQVDTFLKSNPRFTLQKDHSFSIGIPGDGFYCAVLRNNSGVSNNFCSRFIGRPWGGVLIAECEEAS
jgi:16S rRNA C967 or C1407 C5-methylase (RsmB/RsmF family)